VSSEEHIIATESSQATERLCTSAWVPGVTGREHNAAWCTGRSLGRRKLRKVGMECTNHQRATCLPLQAMNWHVCFSKTYPSWLELHQGQGCVVIIPNTMATMYLAW